MPDHPEPHPEESEPSIADAETLFGADAERPAQPRSTGIPSAIHGESYDVEEADEPAEAPRAVFLPPAPSPKAPRAADSPRPGRITLEPSDAVEQVWSRWAEWGATLGVLTLGMLGLILLLALAWAMEAYPLAALIFFAGGAALAVLSYPMLITLERPVRVTPEQAVKDFYQALSHHVPHYRRMWLLLSRAGRTSSYFGSFEGFQGYWRERLDRLRAGRIGKYTPFKFQVVSFKAGKSAGQTSIDARYVIEVSVRGRQNEGPIATFPIESSLVRGPDKMWYLNSGILPEQSQPGSTTS